EIRVVEHLLDADVASKGRADAEAALGLRRDDLIGVLLNGGEQQHGEGDADDHRSTSAGGEASAGPPRVCDKAFDHSQRGGLCAVAQRAVSDWIRSPWPISAVSAAPAMPSPPGFDRGPGRDAEAGPDGDQRRDALRTIRAG